MKKWGLSFNSSRPNRQTKKLWVDANLKCIDEDYDINKMKVLGLFLDVSLSAQDPPAQRSVIDELSEDLLGIFQTLIFWTKLCQQKIDQTTTFNHEEVAAIGEIIVKALAVVEILSTTKGTKVSLRDLIVTNNPCIRSILEALPVMESLSNKLSLIRILRAVMFNEAHLIELAKIDGFRTLSSVVTTTNEPALTSQVMHLQRQYMEYIQGAKQTQQLRQEHLTHNITLSNLTNLSQIGANNTNNAYQSAMYSKAGDIALRSRAYSTSSAGSAGGAYAQNTFRGGASSAANSAQARLVTLSASTAASTANLNSTTLLHNAPLHSASFHHVNNHSNGPIHSAYHSTGQLHGNYPSNGFFLDPNTEDTSMAAKGLNLAFNFVNELLKFAPISADWLQAQRPNKDALLLHDSLSQYYDEQISLCNMLLSPATLDIESERVKQLEKGLDQQALELAEHGEETGAEGEVGLVLPTDLIEPNNERSLLYANTSAAPMAQTGINVSAGTPAEGVKAQLSHSQDSSPEVLVQNTVESRTPTASSLRSNSPRPASRQSSRELGYVPSFPFNDPLEYIRSQIQEQDLSSVLLLAMEKAATPSEGLEALATLQAMLIGDPAAQNCFAVSESYSIVSAMFLRIEENLVLLVPVTDSSMAAAAGQGAAGQNPRHDPNRRSTSSASTVSSYDNTSISGGFNNTHNNHNNSPHKHSTHPDKHSKEAGLYNHPTKGEFDVYYSTVVMILLNILLDDVIITQISSNLPFLPPRGAEIGNFTAMQLLTNLLHSGSSGLLTVGMRIIYALMKTHSPNVLVLESAGVIGALVEILCTILYTKTIDTSALTALFTTVNTNHGEFSARESVSDYNEIIGKAEDLSPLFASHKSINNLTDTNYVATTTEHCSHQLLHTLVGDIVTILQIVSVTTSNRDSSIVCLLTLLSQQCSTYYRMLNLHSSGCSTVNSAKCQNCEMETACLQCLNDGCMNDQSFLLCQECDNVFHKSTVKKSHIRIPVLPTNVPPALSQSNSQDKLHGSIGRDSSGSIRTDSNVNSVVTGINDTYRLPLYKHNLLDSANTLRLPDPTTINNNSSSNNYDSQFDSECCTEHDMSSAVCNESFLCLLLAGIRGILDDREVRGLGLPHLLFPSLLITLRTAVSDPFKIHNRNTSGGNNANVGNNGAAVGMDELYGCYSRAMFRLPDQVRLCELVDSRADVLTPLADLHANHSPVSASTRDKSSHNLSSSNHNNSSYFAAPSNSGDAPTPPEVTHNSSRRVRLSLLVQCVARFVMSRSIVDAAPNLFASDKDGYNELSALFKHTANEYEHTSRRTGGTSSRAMQVQMLQQLMVYGGDALLVHLLVDGSIYTQATSIDKQYVVWLLRECLVTSTCAKFEHSDRFYNWLLWIIRGNVSSKGSSEAARSRQRIVRRQSKTSTASTNAVVNTKNSMQTVPPLGRANSNIVAYTAVPSTAPLVTLMLRLMISQELRLLLHAIGEDPARHALAHRELFEYPNLVHLNHIVYSENTTDGPGVSTSSRRRTAAGTLLNGTTTCASAPYNCLFSSFTTRSNLVKAGFVEALLDLIIGEFCTPVVYSVIRDPVAGRSGSSHHSNQSSATHSHEHKSLHITELEKEEWWSTFAALCALLQGCDEAKDALHNYIGIEAFVKFLLPLIEYTTVCSLDVHSSVDYRAVLNTFVVEICTTHGQFAAPAAPFACAVPRLPAQLLLQSFRVENTVPVSDQRKLSKLFVRYATHKHNSFGSHSVNQHSPRKANSAEEHSAVSALSALSPVYYLHERTAFLAGHTTQPLPLSLQNEHFRRAFAIFGVSVPGTASAAGNNNTTAPVVPNKQHTNVSRNSLKASDVFDSRGRLSIDSCDIPGSMGGSSHGPSALRKLHMRRNVSTASIHSAESECHWETESVGVVSSTGDALGRASLHSLHSAHSMIALSQAIGAQATPQTQHSRSTTPAVSVSGDLHTSSHGYSAHHFSAHKASDKQWDTSSHGRAGHAYWDHHHQGTSHAKHKTNGGTNSIDNAGAQYPFPPMTVSNNSVYPCVYVPLLAGFEYGQESFSTSTLLLLHHSLLIRAGYTESIVPSDLLDTPLQEAAQSRQYSEDPVGMRMSFMSSDSTHGHMQLLPESVPDHFSISRAEGVECSVVLRKHLSMFMLSGANNNNRGYEQSERDLAYQPAYSRLQIRSPECCELLLAAAVVSAQQNQTFFLSTLSCMLDGNPANAHAFVVKPSTCIGLSRLMASLREEAQEKVGYLLSQVLRYSLQQPILRELVDEVKKGRSMSLDLLEDEPVPSLDDSADCKSLLFVMGRTAERVGPESFLHIDLGSPFTSRVELPPISSLPVPTVAGSTASNGVTVCSWMRLGSLADAPTCSFLQLHSDSSDLLVDAYFRVVYKLTPKVERSNTESSSSNASTGPVHQISKRVVQLCLSFGKSTTSEVACFENGVPVPAISAHPAPPSPTQTNFSKFWADHSHAEDDQATKQSHWRLAVDQFCYPHKDSAGLDADLPDQPHELHDAAAVLANTLYHFALPDAIVEFDWSEMGDWHLLVLGLSAEQVTCSVDSVARPVLHWSPLGYQYDMFSAAIKQSTDDSIPVLKDPSAVGASSAPPVEPVQVREVGHHVMNFSKALPVMVTVGGLRHEQPAYDLMRNHLACAAGEENAHAELGVASLVQSFDSTVSGFSGTLGEVVVMAGVVEESKVLACLRGGPISGFRDLKANRLSALTSSAVRAPRRSPSIKGGGDSEKSAPALSFPSFLAPTLGTVNNAPTENTPMNIYASNYALVIKEKDDLFGKTRSAKDNSRDTNAVKFSEGVQIHQTTALVGAFNSIGGIRALYPLLAADKARLVAALRIIGSLIGASLEASQDFRLIDADKVILYCCVQNPRLVTIETVQVLFDMTMESTHGLLVANPPVSAVLNGNAAVSAESIQRSVILELLLDIVVALPRNTQLARSAIDWLREICDDHVPNCQKVLKTPGLMPVLIMLAAYDLPGCENLPRGAATASTGSMKGTKTLPPPVTSSVVTESALGDVSGSTIRRGRSASLGSAPDKHFDPLRSSQVVDISKAAAAKLLDTGKLGLNSGSADERVLGRGPAVRAHNDSKLRLMDRVNMEYLQKTLADEQDAAATHAYYTERYKLQLSCSRLIRLLISGTSGEVAHASGNVVLNLNNTSTEFSAQHLAMLLSFAVVAGSAKHVTTTEESAASAADNNNYSRNREQRQRAARVKRLIYGTFSGIPMLRHVDIAAPTYWINSAALVALDSIIDAINSALHVQIVSLLKNSFSAANLHSMMLHLMGSECAEIRERSLRVLLFSFSALDGKLDARQVSSFDRMHGFQCLAAQLSAHPDGCTDAILQGLLSLVFWRRNKRRASSSNGSDIGERRFSIDSHNGEDDEGFFPIKMASAENTRPSSLDLRHHPQSTSAEHTPRGSVTSAGALSPVPVSAEPAAPASITPALTLSTQPEPAAAAAVAPRSPTAGHSIISDPTSVVVPVAAPAAPAAPGFASTGAAASSSTSTAQPSGSLLSLFSWGGSAPAKPTPAPLNATTTSTVSNSTTAAVTVNPTTGKVEIPVVDAPKGTELARKDSSTGSDTHTVNTDEEKSANPERISDTSAPTVQNKIHATDDARTAVNHKIYLVDVIEVPQALEALFAVLENSRSAEQVTGTLKVLEQSVSVTAVAASMHQELSLATNVLHLRNAENFFAQKDWLVWLCDLLVLFARQAMHAEDQEGSASVFSLSESESLTGTGAGAGQGYYGGGCYDTSGEDSESNSVAGDYFSEDPSPNFNSGHRGGTKGGSVGSGESRDGRVTSWQQQLIDQYCAPIYNLIRKLMLQDMTAHKPSSARRWNELFRLSLPELNSIQERLLTDLVLSMRNLSEFCEDINATLNLLKNLSALLEQALEKVDLSLVFCVKVVQALHTLTYTCAPEVRSRIKETALPEMRKQFVVRCLLENSQDYYNKVAAISEISSPLMGYVSSTEAKPLSDTNVVMIVLGMLVEACEDLEFLLGGVDSSDVVLNESAGSLRGQNNNNQPTTHHTLSNEDYRLMGSPVPTNAYDRVHLLFEVLEVLIESVQNCVLSSAECRKCVSKLVQNIPGDPDRYCLAAFTKSFNQPMCSAKSSRSSSLIVTTAGPSDFVSGPGAPSATGVEAEGRLKNGTTAGATGIASSGTVATAGTAAGNGASASTQQQQQQQQQSYSWWGGWSTTDNAADPSNSNNNNPNQTPNDKIDAPRNNSDRDLEANRSGKHNSGRLTSTEGLHLAGANGAEVVDEVVQGPANIRAFISWFCAFDQRELQGEFRVRVLNEIRPTQRATDKLREKTAQRYMRHSRQAQEKRTKEKAYISRTAKDALTTVKSTTDKVSAKFQKDTKSWVAGINDRFEGGKTVFNNSFEDRLAGAKSPLKDLKSSNQPLYTHNASSATIQPPGAAGANSVHSSTQPGVFSERLKRFLLAESANPESHSTTTAASTTTAIPPLTTENLSRSASLVAEYDASSALNDLLAYFQQNVSANSVN